MIKPGLIFRRRTAFIGAAIVVVGCARGVLVEGSGGALRDGGPNPGGKDAQPPGDVSAGEQQPPPDVAGTTPDTMSFDRPVTAPDTGTTPEVAGTPDRPADRAADPAGGERPPDQPAFELPAGPEGGGPEGGGGDAPSGCSCPAGKVCCRLSGGGTSCETVPSRCLCTTKADCGTLTCCDRGSYKECKTVC